MRTYTDAVVGGQKTGGNTYQCSDKRQKPVGTYTGAVVRARSVKLCDGVRELWGLSKLASWAYDGRGRGGGGGR